MPYHLIADDRYGLAEFSQVVPATILYRALPPAQLVWTNPGAVDAAITNGHSRGTVCVRRDGQKNQRSNGPVSHGKHSCRAVVTSLSAALSLRVPLSKRNSFLVFWSKIETKNGGFRLMNRVSVKLDASRRAITVHGRTTVLQHKCWQVLTILMRRAPAVVGRADIIDDVWAGNYPSGEKGLNQSVWAIRRALGEDPQAPQFIRTVPRVGYQWIHVDVADANERVPRRRQISHLLAAAAAVAAIALPAVCTDWGRDSIDGPRSLVPPDSVATRAYLVGKDIHVEFASGCIGIVRNQSYGELGTPVLSSDGAQIAVRAQKNDACRLVTLDVASGTLREFGDCPTEAI